MVDRLLSNQNRKSTNKIYLSVWRQFNSFIMKLDVIPHSWEDRTTLFIAYLVDKGMQSSTVKSYVSAIKNFLVTDGYKWRDEEVLLSSLTRVCKLVNDQVKARLPIHCALLEMILFEVRRNFQKSNQPYLEKLYLAMFALGYYGLMRVGELAYSERVVKAKDIHIATNKDKILIILYSSKTHSVGCRPQKIKIVSNRCEWSGKYANRKFCPFALLRNYISARGNFVRDDEQFFIFRDRLPVIPDMARTLLRNLLD